jgi:hypothetical protein
MVRKTGKISSYWKRKEDCDCRRKKLLILKMSNADAMLAVNSRLFFFFEKS